jgi:hypothetical protein
LFAAALAVAALAGTGRAGKRAVAHRTSASIAVDGVLSEQAWSEAKPQAEFWQLVPNEGAPPTTSTEFRVLYDDTAIYVGVRAFDNQPDTIRGQLTRRDEDSSSDWITVSIDSYGDNRTAFAFSLNAAGVQHDMLLFDDVKDDASWNAVWDGATSIDESGWVAEYRIPFSQLRFPARSEHEWGIQVQRYAHRSQEITFWSPTPSDRDQMVSQFGSVVGIEEIRSPRRLELLPYAIGGVRTSSERDREGVANFGIDFKYGPSSNVTLSGAINPDFGQVEADPSQINLTASEIFLPEKRPFFVEGVDIFRVALGSDEEGLSEQLFYSRRIGSTPHGAGVAPDEPTSTSIYGAGKLSGKTAGGFALGGLVAVTGEETAHFVTESGDAGEQVIEPSAVYSVARLARDFDGGRTTVGAFGTAVRRSLDGTRMEWLHDRALAGGVEFRHRAASGRWQTEARVLGSNVHGDPMAIDLTQRASQRYYQRPDADYLDYDPARTSLSGVGAVAAASASASKHVRGAVGVDTRSPGFETNDLGFQLTADETNTWARGEYHDETAGDVVRRWSVRVGGSSKWSWAPAHLGVGANTKVGVMLNSFWGATLQLNVDDERLDPRLLRGGPSVRGRREYGGTASLWSDERRKVWFELVGHSSFEPVSDSWLALGLANVYVNPASNVQLVLGGEISGGENDLQYVDTVADTGDELRYVLARVDQTTAAMTLRLSYTLTPRMSLQAYAQPFIAAASYDRYKEAGDLQAAGYEQQFRDLDDGERMQLGVARPDFNLRELRSTVVGQWEYRPGSRLFVIWSHNRSSFADTGTLRPGTEVEQLLGASGEHVVLVKFSYWLN